MKYYPFRIISVIGLAVGIVLAFGKSSFVFAQFGGAVQGVGPSIHQIESDVYSNYEPSAVGGSGSFSGQGYMSSASVPIVNKVVLGFHPYWVQDYASHQYHLLSHIAYFGVVIGPDGRVVNASGDGWPHHGLVSTAHQHGVKVIVVFRNFNKSELTTLLSNAENRNRAIETIISEVAAGNADGVNIDFENVDGSQRDNLALFMSQLSAQLRSARPGSHLSIDIPAVDWSNVFDIPKLRDIVDFMMMMGYDYHYKGSAQAGPVAPLISNSPWGSLNVTKSVNNYLAKIGADRAHKLVLGVPYYGYDWPTANLSVPSSTSGQATARFYKDIRAGFPAADRKWDNASQTPYYLYTKDGQSRQLWYEDEASLSRKYDFVRSKSLGGIGIWALGYDQGRTELWDLINAKFGDPSIANSSLRIITAPGRGGGPHVKAFSTGGSFDTSTNFLAYESNFRGGVNIATGDIDKDGADEIIVGAGPGGGPHLRVFERNGEQRGIQFFPFHPDFRGGLSVAAGDVDGDGKAEIGVCQQTGGQAWVKVYRYNDQKTILAYFNAFGAPEVGCNLAFGDVDGDGKDELIVGAGPGGGPHVRVYDIGTTGVSGPNQGASLKSIGFFAFHPHNRSGIDVAAGDVTGDGRAEIAVSQLAGDEAWVKVYRFDSSQTVLGNFRAYGQGIFTGARISMGDVDGDGKAEIVTGPDANGGPHVRAFKAHGAPLAINFFAYAESFRGGVRPAVADF
jgi:spore germination protein YaaH